jgi:hypothetical protein
MPNKKQSARPAESGWLLEVGVIGIDKTLKLIKLSKWTLVELEILFRQHSIKPVEGETTDPQKKAGLPWFPIDEAHRTEFEPDLILYPIEGREDYQRCLERFFKCLVSESESKRRKGRGPTSDRQPLYRWLMNADTLNLIVKGPEGVEVRSKRLKKIKAYCLLLADAVKVIRGERSTMPTTYPESVKAGMGRKDFSKNLRKVGKIIELSLLIPKQRDEALALAIARTEQRIREKEAELKVLHFQTRHLRQLEAGRKKVGKRTRKS